MMTLSDDTLFKIVWLSLLGTPIISFSVFFFIRRQWPRTRFSIFVASPLVLISSFVFAFSGLSFTAALANFLLFFLAYASYSFLAAYCLQIPHKIIRIIAFVAAAIPICIGYFLATFGIFIFVLFLGDFMQRPYKTERMNDQLTCRVIGWGNVATNSGYEVNLYRTWSFLPFLQMRVARISINETSPDPKRKDATCADVLASYKSR